jgi:hypothetical protein
MSTVNTMSGDNLVKQVRSPDDDGLDAVRAYMAGGALDAATETEVKAVLARCVPDKNVIETTIDYTYYPRQKDGTTPIDTITVTEKNTVTLATRAIRTIKHYVDGRQPQQI